jgi:hypothetical protein
MNGGKKRVRRREPYRRRRSARGTVSRAATQGRLIVPGLRIIATLLAATGRPSRPGGIEQESGRLWGSPGDLSIRRSG